MSIPQLNNPKKLSYNELRTQVSELARRMNILTEMRAVQVDYNAAAKFTFSDSGATLDVPRLDELIQQLEEALKALGECETALAACTVKVDCLEDIITPGTVNGAAAWSHSASSYRPQPVPCSASYVDAISVKYLETVGIDNIFQFARSNSAQGCVASGSINFAISTELGPGTALSISWSGDRGDDSLTTKSLSAGTYYVYAAGVNLNNNLYGEPWQYKGSFTISATNEVVRTITTSVTTTDGDAAPCA